MLEINNSHKKIDLKTNKPLKRIAALTVGLTIALYSGISIAEPVYADGTINANQIERDYSLVPESCYEDILSFCDGNKITKHDLENFEEMIFSINNKDSLEFLKYCKNVKKLYIAFTGSKIKNLDTIPHIDGLESLELTSIEDAGVITNDNKKFFKICKGLKKLQINNFSITKNSIEQIEDLKEFGYSGKNLDADLTKVADKINLKKCGVYNIPLFMTSKDYNKIKDSGKTIEFGSEKKEEKFLELDKKLNKIIKDLNLKDEKNEKAKVDKILWYVLKNLKYNKEIADHDEYSDVPGEEDFYKNGALYAFFERDDAICGTYAALAKSLWLREGIDSYYTASYDHAWNLVKINNEVYLIDPTWLDDIKLTVELPEYDKKGEYIGLSVEEKNSAELIKEGYGDKLDWYLEDPSQKSVNKLDKSGSHTYKNYTEEFGKSKPKESSLYKVIVRMCNTEIHTTMAAVIGIGLALGSAINIPNEIIENRKANKPTKRV